MAYTVKEMLKTVSGKLIPQEDVYPLLEQAEEYMDAVLAEDATAAILIEDGAGNVLRRSEAAGK